MPDFDQPNFQFTLRHFVQLLVLVLAVPLQYYVTMHSSESTRQYELDGILTRVNFLTKTVFNMSSLLNWCQEKLSYYGILVPSKIENFEEDTGKQDDPRSAKKRKPSKEDYGLSLEPRIIRPPQVKFKVGQVVKHKERGFTGVIVGWDEKAKAPTEFLRKKRDKEIDPEWDNMPNYAVLVDIRHSSIPTVPEVAYVVQEHIEPTLHKRVQHPLVSYYFEHYDNHCCYVMRPWLHKVYPHDHKEPV